VEENTFTSYDTGYPYYRVYVVGDSGQPAHNRIINNTILCARGGIEITSTRYTTVANNTITGTGYYQNPPAYLYHAGVKITTSYHTYLFNNTISNTDMGVVLYIYGGISFGNVTMRNNTLLNNYFNFYPHIDDTGTNSAGLDNDIDTSNTVNGLKIYYLKNTSGQSFSDPSIGYFACINCYNITLSGVNLMGNSQGVFLYNTSDSLISGITARNNRYGVMLQGCRNITISGSSLGPNYGTDLSLFDTNLTTIHGSNLTGATSLTRKSGAWLYYSYNNTFHSNNISANTYGVYIYGYSYNNTFYNNIFSNTINAHDTTSANYWNTTRTPGTNIIGGPFLGGNSWSDYTGEDLTGSDGIGDTLLPHNSSGNIKNGGDYLPLVAVNNDTTAPWITIHSPTSGTTYPTSYVHLKVSSPHTDVDRWWYSLDGGANVSFTPNTTITGLTNGAYSLIVYVNDTSGNLNWSRVNFTVSIQTGGGGGDGPAGEKPLEEVPEEESELEITILSPVQGRLYTNRTLDLIYTSQVPLVKASYTLDGAQPVAVDTDGSDTIPRLTLGTHHLVLSGQDYYGLKGRAEADFLVLPLSPASPEPAGFPEFPDEVAYGFTGRSVAYVLEFTARDLDEGEVSLYLNRRLDGTMGGKHQIVEVFPEGGLLATLGPAYGWRNYSITIPAEMVRAGEENIITFVHQRNPSKEVGLESWKIANLTLMPQLPETGLPWVEVSLPAGATSGREELPVYLRLEGTGQPELYDAYLYLVAPGGRTYYYPAWTSEPSPLDSRFLETHYYGRLPGALTFTGDMMPGTYALVGKVTWKDSLDPVAFSGQLIYYNPEPSVKLMTLRNTYNPGQELVVMNALTAGNETYNGILSISLEDPSGGVTYLPWGTAMPRNQHLEPAEDSLETVLRGAVDRSWQEGEYILRSALYSEAGDLLADDIKVFEVCQRGARVSVGFHLPGEPSAPLSAREGTLTFYDFHTGEPMEIEVGPGATGLETEVPAGRYYVRARLQGDDGTLYQSGMEEVSLDCGEEKDLDLKFEILGTPVAAQGGVLPASYTTGRARVRFLAPYQPGALRKVQEGWGDSCSKPKVVLITTVYNSTGLPKAPLSDYYATLLRETSPGVRLLSFQDMRALLKFREDQLLLGAIDGNELNEIGQELAQQLKAGYLISLNVGRLGDTFVLTSSLLDADNIIPIKRSTQTAGNEEAVLAAVEALASVMGHLDSVIESWEETHPLPPRDPVLSFSLTPETVSMEWDKNKATLTVKVTDCRGDPVDGAKVYIRQKTVRGVVEGPEDRFYSGYVVLTTGPDGTATTTYDLLEGVQAGVDVIKGFTLGRGKKVTRASAIVKIAGIGLAIYPRDRTVEPTRDTLVYIKLYREDEKGRRTPMAGEQVVVDSSRLRGGKLVPLGPVSSLGNPVTDETGTATMRFIASRKEGMVSIPAWYNLLNGERVKETASIRVKESEFVLLIDWTETSHFEEGGNSHGSISCRELCCDKDDCRWHTSSGSYDIEFQWSTTWTTSVSLRTYWKRGTGMERTSGQFTSSHQYSHSWKGSGTSSGTCGTEGGSSSNNAYVTRTGSVSSSVQDELSWIILELRSGDLFLRVSPIKYPVFPVKGTETWSSTSETGDGSSTVTFQCTYDGNELTKPGYSCWFVERKRVKIPYYEVRPEPFLILRKTGKDTWESVAGSYEHTYPWSGSFSWAYDCCRWTGSCQETGSSSKTVTISGDVQIRVVKR